MLLRIRPDPMNTYNNTNKQHQYTATTAGSSNRLRSLFPQPESNATTGLELDEDDIFSTGFPSSPINSPQRNNPPNLFTQKTASCRRFLDSSVGILAVLPDMNPNNPVIMPKVSISFYSSAMMIPLKKKKESKKVYHQSAPVRVPVGRRGGGAGDQEDDEDGVLMMPPHEIVARREASPMTTFSVLEGAGRTLKGRDLRRVRNAVFRTTGFED